MNVDAVTDGQGVMIGGWYGGVGCGGDHVVGLGM